MRRTWLITGVSSGFGNEMTKQLLRMRDTVFGTVRSTGAFCQYSNTFDGQLLKVTED